MKILNGFAILALLALGTALTVDAAKYTPNSAPVSQDVRWTPAAETPVDVETALANTVTLPTVRIVATRPRARQTAQCGAFGFRALEQGRGDVRGFCGDGQ